MGRRRPTSGVHGGVGAVGAPAATRGARGKLDHCGALPARYYRTAKGWLGTMIRSLIAASSVGVLCLLSGCDPIDYAQVSALPPQSLTNSQATSQMDEIAREAGLARTHDWFCDQEVKPPACNSGTGLETWYQGRGQTIPFDDMDGRLVFRFEATPGLITPETRDDLLAIWKALAKRFGENNVEICHLSRCNRSGHWPKRSWFSSV